MLIHATSAVEFGGYINDPYGNYKLGLSAKTDFGVSFNGALEAGGLMLGDDVTITIDLEAQLQA